MNEQLYVTVVLRSGEPISVKVPDEATARAAILEAHTAMCGSRSFKIGNGAVFAHGEVAAAYVTREPRVQSERASLFDSVFGSRK